MIGSVSRPVGLPFQPAFGALEGAVDVVVAGVAGAGVGFGKRHFIVDVGMLPAQSPPAGRAGAPRFLLAKPTFHGDDLRGKIRRWRRCCSV